MFDVEDIATKADAIVGGFAVLLRKESIKVINLNTGKGAAVFTLEGTLIETNMDDIELAIARDTLADALAYAEV
ncbi:MAG: hypothetical protein IKG22_09375 [Atopobiaceae bacterium]|nr:hypothetical protein [Atopobiaceae bacterium]